MELKVNVPNRMQDITLEQYQKFLKECTDEDLSEEFIAIKMLEIFCGLPEDHSLQLKMSDVMEICEKRALSRCVLKLAGLYELGHMGEDESEDFKAPTRSQQISTEIKRLTDELKDKSCTLERAKEIMEDMQEREAESPNSPWMALINTVMNEFRDLSHQPTDDL